ncbi:MAG TPA: CGNR zinc finger domain-containing protein [Pseudonocardiaceae bacterium]
MSWMATERFGARTAPGGLALVQELVNTHAVARDGTDLLADHVTAEQWLRAAADQWARGYGLAAPELSLSTTDLHALRELRTVVRAMLEIPPDQRSTEPFRATDGVLPRAQAQLVSDVRGRVAMVPLGTDASWLASAVWSEILLAQRNGAWSQLKLCREPGCRSAFYDASRNGSAVWHNVSSCGNIANLRASRARRKAAP